MTTNDNGLSDGNKHRDVLPSKRIPLIGLPANAFQHPLDRKATGALKAIKGFDWLVRKYIEYQVEGKERAWNLGSNVRIGPRQVPTLYGMLREACDVLDVPEPELYVSQGDVNAHASGHDHPYIVLNSGLLDLLNDDEIMAVIAHELGHIKCGHVLYYQMAIALANGVWETLSRVAGDLTLGIGSIVVEGIESAIEVALLAWQQQSELSADRAALLVMQDSRPCVSMLMKLAGGSRRWSDHMDPEQFLNQARAYREGLDRTALGEMYRHQAHGNKIHPACVERARALDEWIGSQEYNDILAGRYPKSVAPSGGGDTCPTCEALNEAGDRFCVLCGTPLMTH
jgi:Zn-dependent protease with chaperone function